MPTNAMQYLLAAIFLAWLGHCNAFLHTNSRPYSSRLQMTAKHEVFRIAPKWLISSAIGLGFASGMPTTALADAIPIVGQDAPAFRLPSNAGKEVSLEDLKGKWTVLYFYPGDFTSGCTIEAKSFEKDYPQYKALGAQILGVSVDSVDKHLDFGKKYGLEFTLLSDQGGIISNKYGSLLDFGFVGKFSNRQTYIISPDLKVKAVFTDVESRLSTHSQDVLSELAKLVNKVTLGEDTYICLYLGPLNWTSSGQYYQLATTAKADKLTRIKVPLSWTSKFYANDTLLQQLQITDQETPGIGLGVSVGSMGILSFQRVYRRAAYRDYSPAPSPAPTVTPSSAPSLTPSFAPTLISQYPSATPTVSQNPSQAPTLTPSCTPTENPSITPSRAPSARPSTASPSLVPSHNPTASPSLTSSHNPTASPSLTPSSSPTVTPSVPVANQAATLAIDAAEVSQRILSADLSLLDYQLNNVTYSITFPVLFAIISVDRGKVKSIAWDNFCSWCDATRCIPNTVDYSNELIDQSGSNCFKDDSECQVYPKDGGEATTELCELTVYISWKGTDSAGSYFESSSSRFSRWSVEQMTNYTSSLQDKVVEF